jgi:EAL and modified HD-GYP domain-containing signal transduction protein
LVRLIKFDLQQSTFAEIEVVLEKLRQFKNLKFLAEKIETQEQYDKAKEMGFDFFQGYYFCTPQIVEQKDINSNQSVVFAMYQETLKLDADYTKLSSFFERDTALAYKLLKFINSGLFPVRKPISSLKQALIYLGAAQVKKFDTLILTAHIAENRRQELTDMSIIRARFCEQIATNAAPQFSDEAFILGLFSLLDVILDQTMEDLVKELPVTEDIASALIGDDNILGNIFILTKAYEAANWELMGEICVKLNIEQDLLPAYYVNAVEWAKIYEESNDSKI